MTPVLSVEQQEPADTRITTTEAARILNVNESRVRQLADEGRLGYVERVPTGHGRTMRLFDRESVEDFKSSR